MFTCPQCPTLNLNGTTLCLSCSSAQRSIDGLPTTEAQSPKQLKQTPPSDIDTSSPSSPQAARFEAGSILAGRYRIVSALGQGGMGEVYRADDLKLGCSVALKFLPPELEQREHRLTMLLDEARLARSVSHPNVCRVHDVDVHRKGNGSELHFVSMEFIDGEDLASLLRRIGRLPQAKALDVAIELCDGLAAVHACGLLHRDLKPGNVMLDGQGRVRLTDFGLAITATETSSLAGTLAYMAPEQLTSRLTTVRSDVYSLGLVLYEIFTGERAFEGTSPKEIAWSRLQTSPESPSSLVEHLPSDIENLILACLEKIPELRLPSVDAVATALTRIVEGDSGNEATSLPQGEMLCALLACDLFMEITSEDSSHNHRASSLMAKAEELAENLHKRHKGQATHTTEGFQFLFERPAQALHFALDYHDGLGLLQQDEQGEIEARIGIHFGEIQLAESSCIDLDRSEASIEVTDGLSKSLVEHLVQLAEGGQTFLSGEAFDLARRASANFETAEDLRWLDHGAWRLHGVADPVDIYEVGHEGRAPLQAPEESENVQRLLMQPRVKGWHPAPGLAVPGRPYWQIEERLGEGGFGEAWLVRHAKTEEPRCFKFCFDAERLRALQREITLFRLLKEELGDRKDIHRLLDWNLEEPPYFIESEYTHIGDLKQWARSEGGLDQVPLETRLDIVAQVAEALAAAHSVGVLHKDVKPSNVLIRRSSDGRIQAQLADFGVGQVTEKERLAAAGITVLGLSRRTGEDTTSTQMGTPLYQAPELLEGRTPTLQSDIYSLGVLLYQVVAGDFHRVLAPGWRREIGDEFLADDIGSFVDGAPERRPDHANDVAQRLRTLDQRRRDHQAAIAAKRALEVARRRRGVYKAVTVTSLIALVAVSILAAWALQANREERRALERTETILNHLISVFGVVDPFSIGPPGEKRGETMTAREILDRGTDRLATEFVDMPLMQARLMDTYGSIYTSLGILKEGQSLHKQALSLRQRWLGPEHPDTLQSMHSLATTLRKKGAYVQSAKIFEQTLESQQRVLGVNHPDTLKTTTRLMDSLINLGRNEEVKEISTKTLETQIYILGVEHPDTLTSMHILAKCLDNLGEYAEARDLNYRILEIRSEILGEGHPETLGSMNNLAAILSRLGEWHKAKNLHERTLAIKSQVLGDEHPDTLLSKYNLAISLARLDKWHEARGLSEDIWNIATRTRGKDDGLALLGSAFLAYTLSNTGDYERAEEIFETSSLPMTITLENSGETTLYSTFFFSVALKQIGNLEKAGALLQSILQETRIGFGDKHILSRLATTHHAEVLSQLGDLHQAQHLLDENLKSQKDFLPGDHPETQEAKIHLASVLMKTDELERAKQVARSALVNLRTKLGTRHSLTTQAAHLLLEIALHENDINTARRYIEKLQWLTETDKSDIESAKQHETRRYVIEVMDGIRGSA